MSTFDLASAVNSAVYLSRLSGGGVVALADGAGSLHMGEAVYLSGDYRAMAGLVPLTAGADYLCIFVGSQLIVIGRLA